MQLTHSSFFSIVILIAACSVSPSKMTTKKRAADKFKILVAECHSENPEARLGSLKLELIKETSSTFYRLEGYGSETSGSGSMIIDASQDRAQPVSYNFILKDAFLTQIVKNGKEDILITKPTSVLQYISNDSSFRYLGGISLNREAGMIKINKFWPKEPLKKQPGKIDEDGMAIDHCVFGTLPVL